MINVMIADDHTIVRAGIVKIISRDGAIAVIDEAESGNGALALAPKKKYDVIILDIGLPDINGLEVLSQMRNNGTMTPVLILSMYSEESYALKALRAGASGYLTKHTAPDELIIAIKKIASGGRYITESLADRLSLEIAKDHDTPLHETLSPRELNVLCMIAQGCQPREIALSLNLSVKTVNTYRARILDKLQLSGNAELIRYVINHKLIE
ncbi:MAG: response regulator transcription factor [Nitrospirae bacterium]|nr:MAG: response regulator transcription factor [Nitrospirota bacterium]